MSGLRTSASGAGSSPSLFLILPAAYDGGPEVGDGRGHHHRVGVAGGLQHGLAQLLGGPDGHHVGAGRVGQAVLAATRVTRAPRATAVRASA